MSVNGQKKTDSITEIAESVFVLPKGDWFYA